MSEIVRIGNDLISLHLALPEHGMPEILAFGPMPASEPLAPLAGRAQRVNGMDVAVPSTVLLPAGGMGFFGWPAVAGHRDGRDFIAGFSDWFAQQDGATTVLSARDDVAKLALHITVEAFEQGVLSMRSTITNSGDGVYTVDRLMAVSMSVSAGLARLTRFSGMWGREFHAVETDAPCGLSLQESRRGRTSHDRFPGVFIAVGNIWTGLHLGWSGNHQIAIDTLDDGRRLIHAGELFEPGEIRLDAGKSYESPKAYLSAAMSADDLASRFRSFVSNSLLSWPLVRPRPVTLNTWEGNYFDHRLDALKAQADAAAAIGIERFVLDDGWFGKRDDDSSSLGDWLVDKRKYPHGLAPLIDHVLRLGMEFGLWFEPEMVNPDSDLYRAHPDWVLQVEDRPLLLSRKQLVLDLTRPEVADILFDRISKVLARSDITYLKWDMNRDLTHPGDRNGRAATSRQTRAVYALIDRLRAVHPRVEFESCASGGGRADYGVLERTVRLWTSDGTDALERLEIQRGASMFFPPEILGAHVSASPNHQTGRRHSLSFRAAVALAYHLGVELDTRTLTEAERGELGEWIALHKRLRPLLHGGGRPFHAAPLDGRYVWGVTAEDRIVLFIAQALHMMAEQPPPLKLAAIGVRDGDWRIAAIHPADPSYIRTSNEQERLLNGEILFSLASLRHVGLPLPMLRPESAVVLEIERVGGD